MLTDEDFAAAAGQYMDMVYRVALNCVKSSADADDVTQNVMLRLCRTRTDFSGGEHLRAWLIRVTINESKRLLTTPWRTRTVELDQAADHPVDPEQKELLEAVRALPRKYRLPLYLYYYEGYSVDEIAGFLGRPPSTVQTHLSRGRAKLKIMLTEG